MRHRLTLYRPTAPAADYPPADEVLEPAAEVWATITPRGGGEKQEADKQTERELIAIRFRWGQSVADCSAGWWGAWHDPTTGKTRRYLFRSVRNEATRHRWIEADATLAAEVVT